MNKYRTVGPRFWAGFIDGLVLFPISLFDDYLSSPKRGLIILVSWAIVSYTAYWLYSVSLHARYGQTLGKRAMRVKVLDVSEERIPSIRQALLRDIGYIILNLGSLIYFLYLTITGAYTGSEQFSSSRAAQILGFTGLAWFLLEIGTTFLNPKRRAVHDLIAKTVVVQVA